MEMNAFIQCCGAFILTTAQKTNDRWFRSLVKVLKLHVVKGQSGFSFWIMPRYKRG
ncbi:hypothetical protein GFU50_03165 [Enterococcus casseliflavus]|uniref:Uncharacterized protein n=1 Tax=Enterococcus casseliflavus TaxID=37734 RepID=A0ABD6YWW3_ENTCA|nr:hypothetical protein [Enterococcus casseliflavus]MBE9880305.1 hypothetical protein [Enterococcus casseliflavus]QGN28566.1 hypothetical protein GFU50_03165 [Enterococcus casseliflavus]